MTSYLLDTSVLIDMSRGRASTAVRLRELMTGQHVVAVTAVQVAEFFSGVAPQDRPRWDAYFATLRFWALDRLTARQAGMYRYDFARRGVTLSAPDTLIAASAWRYQAILVTNNPKDFPMTDIQLLNLRLGQAT